MWKSIENYEGYYEVSDTGKVRSLDRYVVNKTGNRKGVSRLLRGKTMKLSEAQARQNGQKGYLVVNLRKDNTSSVVPVHTLVARAFIPNPYGLPTVNHKDGDKHNNHASNLEWVTYADNNIHALQCGLRRPRGNKIGQYTIDGLLVSTYKSTCEASRKTGVSRGGISHCVNGRTNQSGGFVWRKISEGQTTIPTGSTQEDELPVEAQRPSSPKAEDIVCAVSNNG